MLNSVIPDTIPDREPVTGRVVTGGASARWLIDGISYLNFSGASYLALHRESALRNAARAVIEANAPFSQQLPPPYGIIDPLFESIEAIAAQYLETEASVFFATGYFIGQIGLAAHSDKGDHLYLDSGAHYNLVQAATLSGLPVTRFTHGEPQALKEALSTTLSAGQRPLVLSDGTFPTTGRLAPLDQYAALLSDYGGSMFIDDAHGFGVLGKNGRGALDHFGLEGAGHVGGTLSKAFCAQGAIVGCSAVAAHRINSLPPKRGANAGSPISAAVAGAALKYMQQNPERRVRLLEVAEYARGKLQALGLSVSGAPTHIMSFRTGSREMMRKLQLRLFERQIYLPVSDYIGAGPEGVFRCAIFADHTTDDINLLTEAIAELI